MSVTLVLCSVCPQLQGERLSQIYSSSNNMNAIPGFHIKLYGVATTSQGHFLVLKQQGLGTTGCTQGTHRTHHPSASALPYTAAMLYEKQLAHVTALVASSGSTMQVTNLLPHWGRQVGLRSRRGM